MTFLVDFQIKNKIYSDHLIEKYIDLDTQLQPNSFEFTIDKIYSILDIPTIDFDNTLRNVSKCQKLDFTDEFIKLDSGIYKIELNEILNLSDNMLAFGFARSSLIRSGISIHTSIWDSGYTGKSECLLVIHNKNGVIFKKNARILQLLFYELDVEVENKYSGIYLYENMF